jgi:hypothetical protein
VSGKFFYLECPVCEWDCVVASAATNMGLMCPVCAEDNGREIWLRGRDAEPEDRPEGHDARRDAT